MILMILKMIGCLALLMFGMKTMSEGLQKLTGGHLRAVLGTMTKHRVGGLLTGTFVTAAVQSSTATTVLTVSFVNAGLLTLGQAIPVIMGANIGTTATAWVMSIFGFQFNLSSFVWPIFAVGIILGFTKKNGTKSFGEFIMGFAFMFLGLCTLRENAVAMDLSHNETVINFFTSCGGWGIWTTLLFLVLGSVLTMCVQSSAAIMAITLILCSSGVLPIYQGIALVMGENIGTTVTSNLAALSASTQARRAALAHMLFNVFGVIWVLIVFHPFVNMVCHFVGFDPNFVPQTQEEIAKASVRVTYALSGFHTAFNLCNVLILIWFIKPMEKLICKIIQGKKEEEEDFRLKFISSGMLTTSELSLYEAQKEINNFAIRTQKMFRFVPTLLETHNEDDFNKLFSRIEKYEGISDNIELEIADYLNKVTEGHLSPESKTQVQCMLKEISEIESIGDACYNMARAISRKFSSKDDFTDEQYAHIRHMMVMCDNAMEFMLRVVNDEPVDVNQALNNENEINNYRKQLRDKNFDDVNDQKYNYRMGVHYMDVVNNCEKMADYVINVVEAHAHVRLTY